MRENRISSTELARSIGEVLGRLRHRGDSFVIEKNGKPVALLSPYPGSRKKTLKEALAAWVQAGAPDRELADLLEDVGRTDAPPENPWESS